MKQFKSIYITVLLLIAGGSLFGQDIHFSQPEYSPMTVSPSLAGTDAPIRVGVKFRNQWPIVGPSFNTTNAYADMRFGEGDRPLQNYLSLGLNIYNDMAGGSNTMTNKGDVNLAYHLGIDDNNRVGAGIYLGAGQRYVNSNGKWESQYDGSSYNSALESGEEFDNRSYTFADVGFGFDYQYRSGESAIAANDTRQFNAGVAIYHINRPQNRYVYSLDSDLDQSKLPIRFSYFMNGSFGLRQTRNTIMPGIYINHQRNAFEIMYGAYYGYIMQEGSKITGFRKPTMIAGGIFHRFNDAIILKGLLEIKAFAVGMSYDINLSTLTPTSRSVGGFEMFVMYRARYSKRFKDKGTL